MSRNVGSTDRLIRFAVALVAIVVALVAGPGSVLGVILFIVAGIMSVTGATGVCPLYRLVGVDTCKVRSAPKR
jgi:hypothetical protein